GGHGARADPRRHPLLRRRLSLRGAGDADSAGGADGATERDRQRPLRLTPSRAAATRREPPRRPEERADPGHDEAGALPLAVAVDKIGGGGRLREPHLEVAQLAAPDGERLASSLRPPERRVRHAGRDPPAGVTLEGDPPAVGRV